MENHPTRGLRLPITESPWYCGRVHPGRERAFERGLRRFGIPTYLPVHMRAINRSFDTYTREMPLFPGYVFVSLADGQWSAVRERQSYRPMWLEVGGRPIQIPIDVLEGINMREDSYGRVQLDEYAEGDELEVTEGAWRGYRGLLASDPARRVLTLHLIAESYALQPTIVLTKLKVERTQVRRAL